MADAHFCIEKEVTENESITHVRELSDEGSKIELARMLGGENVTETSLAAAAELRGNSRQYKEQSL